MYNLGMKLWCAHFTLVQQPFNDHNWIFNGYISLFANSMFITFQKRQLLHFKLFQQDIAL